jgi:hypothetical protein
VSLDDLQEKLAEFEDYVQSSDVAAMQSERCRFHCVKHESDLIPQSCELFARAGGCCMGNETVKVMIRKFIFVLYCLEGATERLS